MAWTNNPEKHVNIILAVHNLIFEHPDETARMLVARAAKLTDRTLLDINSEVLGSIRWLADAGLITRDSTPMKCTSLSDKLLVLQDIFSLLPDTDKIATIRKYKKFASQLEATRIKMEENGWELVEA